MSNQSQQVCKHFLPSMPDFEAIAKQTRAIRLNIDVYDPHVFGKHIRPE